MAQNQLAKQTISPTDKKRSRRRQSELISYRISVLNRAFEQEAGRVVAKSHALSLTEARVLGMLDEASPTTVKNLAHDMLLKRPQVSRALGQLQEWGLVEAWRNSADGRSTIYAISKKGRALARKVLEEASAYNHARLAKLTPEECIAVFSAIDKLLEHTAQASADPE